MEVKKFIIRLIYINTRDYRCLVDLGNSYTMLFFADDGSRLHRMNIVRIEEDASLFQVCIYIMVNSLNIFNVNSGPAMLSTNH